MHNSGVLCRCDINVVSLAVGSVQLGQLPRCTVSPPDHTHQRRFSGSALAVVLSVCVWPAFETSLHLCTWLHASFNSFTPQLEVHCVAALCKLLGLQHFFAQVALACLPSLCAIAFEPRSHDMLCYIMSGINFLGNVLSVGEMRPFSSAFAAF